MKIYGVEMKKKGFDEIPMKELVNMVGWIEPPLKEGEPWDVTMANGSGFSCKTQIEAQLLASLEEVKALLIKKGGEAEESSL